MLEMLFGSGVRVKGQEECEHRGSRGSTQGIPGKLRGKLRLQKERARLNLIRAVQDSISGPEPEKLKVARLDKAGMCAGRFEQNFIAEVYAPGK
jgi:hypothetical protein